MLSQDLPEICEDYILFVGKWVRVKLWQEAGTPPPPPPLLPTMILLPLDKSPPAPPPFANNSRLSTEQSRANRRPLRCELPVLRLQRVAVPARWNGCRSGRYPRERVRLGRVRRPAAGVWRGRGRCKRTAHVGGGRVKSFYLRRELARFYRTLGPKSTSHDFAVSTKKTSSDGARSSVRG